MATETGIGMMKAATRSGKVEMSLDKMDKVIEDLDSITQEIEGRIAAVLAPFPPKVLDNRRDEPEVRQSGLVNRLQDYTTRLVGIVTHLRDVSELIEL